MTNTRKTPASYIKEALKQAFPWVKFSCKYKSFAWGDDVNVSWTWWPSQREVEKIADQFQMWDFNGMEDIYEYRETGKPYEQLAKYVFCARTPAEGEEKEIIKEIEWKKWIHRQIFIDSINRDFQGIWTKYDALKCWTEQFLREIWYDYDEANDKARIVKSISQKQGLFSF